MIFSGNERLLGCMSLEKETLCLAVISVPGRGQKQPLILGSGHIKVLDSCVRRIISIHDNLSFSSENQKKTNHQLCFLQVLNLPELCIKTCTKQKHFYVDLSSTYQRQPH